MQPTIGIAFARKLLGPSPGRPLRRKCNRIGGRARQAFRDFLKRELAAVPESPDGILEAAE